MFMQQAVIRWLEEGGYVLVRIMVLLFIVLAGVIIFGMHLQRKKEYEKADILYKIFLGTGGMASFVVVVAVGILSQSNKIFITSMLATILFIVLFPIFRHCLERDFLKNLISSCLQKMKRLDSEQREFTMYVSKTKIIVWTAMKDTPLIETDNPLSIQASQAEKWIDKMKGVRVSNAFEKGITFSIKDR